MIQEPRAGPAELGIAQIARMIDHSLLRPTLSRADILNEIALAKDYRVGSVCLRPCDVELAARALQGTEVVNCVVIGFPHGSHRTETKVFEARRSMDDGAVELDMVLPIGYLIGGDIAYVEQDIRAVVQAAHSRSAIVKVIFETGYLNAEQIVTACRISEQAGAEFVKTCTGYGPRGATVEDVQLMRRSCSPHVAIKVAGGIRTLDDLLRLYHAGATRFGTRATKEILDQAALLEARAN